MTKTADRTNDYRVKITNGDGMSMSDLKIKKTIKCDIVFVDAEGKETHAIQIDTYFAGTAAQDKAIIKRLRGRANIQLGRLRAYRERTGERWEVVKERERIAKREAERMESRRKQAVRDAAPDMLAVLEDVARNATMSDAMRAKVRDVITKANTIPQPETKKA